MNEPIRELTMNDLAGVTGGLIVEDDAAKKFWLVKQDGTVIGPAPDMETAISFAKAFNTSPDILTMEGYKKRFGRDLIW